MSLETLTGSPYLSYSSIESFLTCGERYRLQKVVGVVEQKAWYLLGGSAVHEATELIDKGEQDDAQIAWEICWAKQVATIDDPSTVRAGGRATKENPNKEDAVWWNANGPHLVRAWLDWKDARVNEGWTLLDVEHSFEIELGTVPVRGFIDRIMADANGQVHVIDLKTGSRPPSSSLQTAIYALAYEYNTGTKPTFGSYFMNRKGEPTTPAVLSKYTAELVGGWFNMARRAIEAEIFVPHASGLCLSCPVKDKCSLNTGQVLFS